MSTENNSKTIRCGKCNRRLRIPASVIGKNVRCPSCQNLMFVVASRVAPLEPDEADYEDLEDDTSDSFGQEEPLLPSCEHNSSSPRSRSARDASKYQSHSNPNSAKPKRSHPQSSGKSLIRVLTGILILSIVSLVVIVAVVAIKLGRDALITLTQSTTQNDQRTNEPRMPLDDSHSVQSNTSTAGLPNSTLEDVNTRSGRDATIGPSTTLKLPELPSPKKFSGTDISVYEVSFVGYSKRQMRIRVYEPPADLAIGSRACVMIAPAGTPLLHGLDIGDSDNMQEFMPFIQAGMMVVTFGLDGFMPEIDPSNEAVLLSSMQKAYEEFVKSEAGVNNGKSAIDFVLAKFPKVDPKRIYSSGHSSAATLSLLLAAKDHRISKCIAFAPVTDLRMRHGDMLKEPKIMRYFPGIRDYLRTGSPSSYVDVFRCPVFIVHARDDDNEPFANTKTFVSLLKSKGAEVKFVELRTGGHYQPIMDVGIPQAIAWLDKP